MKRREKGLIYGSAVGSRGRNYLGRPVFTGTVGHPFRRGAIRLSAKPGHAISEVSQKNELTQQCGRSGNPGKGRRLSDVRTIDLA